MCEPFERKPARARLCDRLFSVSEAHLEPRRELRVALRAPLVYEAFSGYNMLFLRIVLEVIS